MVIYQTIPEDVAKLHNDTVPKIMEIYSANYVLKKEEEKMMSLLDYYKEINPIIYKNAKLETEKGIIVSKPEDVYSKIMANFYVLISKIKENITLQNNSLVELCDNYEEKEYLKIPSEDRRIIKSTYGKLSKISRTYRNKSKSIVCDIEKIISFLQNLPSKNDGEIVKPNLDAILTSATAKYKYLKNEYTRVKNKKHIKEKKMLLDHLEKTIGKYAEWISTVYK